MAIEDASDTDDQDLAEAFDEETLGVPGDERATFEELPDLLDVTQAVGDDDDDEALIGEELDDDEIIALEEDADLDDAEDDDLGARGDEIADDATAISEDRRGSGPRRGDN